MKKYIGYYIAGNFYGYSIYEITDAHKKKLYMAEPVGAGATRSKTNLNDLYYQLEKDVLPYWGGSYRCPWRCRRRSPSCRPVQS